ncbi:MAG: hypothetical protein HKL84_08585 [Acidimicrobiaceae bacterium]|nr:hypothetical protein [Acidimicrobiaceae bacterium]
MDNSSSPDPPTVFLTAELLKFSSVYAKSKIFGIVAASLWVFGLIEVGLAGILKTTWQVSSISSVAVIVLIALIGFLFYRAGMRGSGGSEACSNASGGHGCSQAGCDSESGGCLGKFDRDVAQRIARMEKEKLSLLLRRKIGVELVLPLFWIVIGVKVAVSGGTDFELGGLALIIGSCGLMGTRLYLGAGVFR